MNLKNKVKSYSFWISLISAILIVVRIVGEHFNWFINEGFIMDVVTAVCGVLVLLGILSAPANSGDSLKEQAEEIQQNQNKLNSTIKEDIMAEKLTIQEQIEVLKNGLAKNDETTRNMQAEQPQQTKQCETAILVSDSQVEDIETQQQTETFPIESIETQQQAEVCFAQMCNNAIEHAQIDGAQEITKDQQQVTIEHAQIDGAQEIAKDQQQVTIEHAQIDGAQEIAQGQLVASEDVEISQEYDDAGCDNILLGVPEEGDITSLQDSSQVADSILISDDADFVEQNAQTAITNQEMALDEVLSNLDKSQLKALLMDILMRL